MLDMIKKQIVVECEALGWEIPVFKVERPKNTDHGHASCNIAMILTRQLRRNPREIAQELVTALASKIDMVEKIEIAGPGFINFTFKIAYFQSVVTTVLDKKDDYAKSNPGAGKTVQVEFVSANPTGPLTIGHGRQAVLGDVISRILEWQGYDVTREYYFNDAGRQMRMLGLSVCARYQQSLGKDLEIPEGGYEGEYIKEIAEHVKEKHGTELTEKDVEIFTEEASLEIFEIIKTTLRRLGVFHDVYFNEKDLYRQGKIKEVLDELGKGGYLYEEEGATWFKATEFGAEKNRVIVKSTGEPTYRLPDIAYHREKIRRGFDLIVDIFGADHIATYPDVQSALQAMGFSTEHIHVLLHQFVTLTKNGEMVKMSTRKANFVTLDELIDIAGTDVVRYFYIMRSMDSHLNFDIELAQKQTDENPVYYLQYAHARMCNILRHSTEKDIDSYEDGDLSLLTEKEIIDMINVLTEFPETMELCQRTLEPMHLTTYLYKLATAFHRFYSVHRVVSENIPLSKARLKLVAAVQIVLANGLSILGISSPEKM